MQRLFIALLEVAAENVYDEPKEKPDGNGALDCKSADFHTGNSVLEQALGIPSRGSTDVLSIKATWHLRSSHIGFYMLVLLIHKHMRCVFSHKGCSQTVFIW